MLVPLLICSIFMCDFVYMPLRSDFFSGTSNLDHFFVISELIFGVLSLEYDKGNLLSIFCLTILNIFFQSLSLIVYWSAFQPFSSCGTFETLLNFWRYLDAKYSANLTILMGPCKELAKPVGSAEPRLKNTGLLSEISPTFYKELIWYKSVSHSFFVPTDHVCGFLQKKIGKKAVHNIECGRN